MPAELVASRRLELLEHFRIPYTTAPPEDADGLERLAVTGGGAILWPRERGRPGVYRLGDIPIFGSISAADAPAGRWRRETPIVAPGGDAVAWILRGDDSRVFLPLDPDELVTSLWSEAYVRVAAGGAKVMAQRVARSGYYLVRPVLPRSIQLAMRRRFVKVQEQTTFPSWPAETALHDLCALLLRLIDEVAGQPVPRIAAWPKGYFWACVLTHDIERSPGYAHLDAVLDVERRIGLRSACYFVPERDYRVEEKRVRELVGEGFEVGVHGLHHDGRDLAPRWFDRRLPAMRSYAERWGATGFRSPATNRDWELMPRLGFDYDTSYSDVARYEPQQGGCCSWLPFFIRDLVELPITLPMDHTLFDLLGHEDGTAWYEKAGLLKERGGMALMLTHPDYLLAPERLKTYADFVEKIAEDETAWHALPREVSAWWRRRAASGIERTDGEWRVVGPAAGEAKIELGA
jgi:peptidoglycan/xylan/chitin deacetylase (PgdA/CDA1 family)